MIQHEAQRRALARVFDDPKLDAPMRILDIGAGTGASTRALEAKFGDAWVTAIDLAPGMVHEAVQRQRRGWLQRRPPIRYVVADAVALPFADAAFDLVFSSLALQWAEPLPAAINEIGRVLTPGGRFHAAMFVDGTLAELEPIFAAAQWPALIQLPDLAALGDALLAQGFVDPVIDRDRLRVEYASLRTALEDVRGIGAGNARLDRRQGLGGRAAWLRAQAAARETEPLVVHYHCAYAVAAAPPAGFVRPTADGSSVGTFPLANLKIRRRDPND